MERRIGRAYVERYREAVRLGMGQVDAREAATEEASRVAREAGSVDVAGRLVGGLSLATVMASVTAGARVGAVVLLLAAGACATPVQHVYSHLDDPHATMRADTVLAEVVR